LDKAAHLDNDQPTLEEKFYPLYNKILQYWFPAADGYDVCPQWIIPDSNISTPNCKEYSIAFVIEHRQDQPLLLLEVKSTSGFQFLAGRNAAVNQIKSHLDMIGPDNQHAERLYAISAFGKRWRAMYIAKGKGSKGGRAVKDIGAVASYSSSDPDCWNPDITSDASYEALHRIVDTIKGYTTT
jgi:hypothetical protein